MIVPLRWLNEIFDTGLSIEKLLDLLTMSGLEVEGTVDLGMASGKIVVAKVLEIAPHPNADKLVLVKVDIGTGVPLDIVCGATNLYDGMLVPCAVPGAQLPDGMKIKKAKIRGEPSAGMLCSARELGFGSDHSGILELGPETHKVGEPFDYLIDLKITPNRPDCLSLMGIARDLAAVTGQKFYPETHRVGEAIEKTDQFIRVTVRARRECPRYTCRYITGVKVGESPVWLKRRLESAGHRSINNIVDVTNYVMLELGIPLHAFDYDRLHGGQIIVRNAEPGEKLIALDGQTLQLHAEDLVIADADRPIALAGVIGGKNTEVNEGTNHILLECANFNPTSIRRAARRHSIQTDSSYRFERGTDPVRLDTSINRATQLILEVAGGDVAKGIIDDSQGAAKEFPPIQLEIDRVNRLLGLQLTNAQIADRLVDLGFEIRRSDQQSLTVARPTYRVDVEEEVDLIEEVARITGYDAIPETMPAISPSADTDRGFGEDAIRRRLRRVLSGVGLDEAINLTIISEEATERHGYDPATQPRVMNPMTIEQTVLRPALLPELLNSLGRNQRHGAERIAFYEMGKIYPPGARPGRMEDELHALGIVMQGASAGNWADGASEFDFYDLKGILETLGNQMGLGPLEINADVPVDACHPGQSAGFGWAARRVGYFGLLHPDLTRAYELRGNVYCAELDLAALIKLVARRRFRFAEIPRLPSSQRDLAVVVDEDLSARELLDAARAAGKDVIEDITLADVYRGEHVEAGKKSVLLRFRLRSADATLTEEQINETMDRVLKNLEERCSAVLRT